MAYNPPYHYSMPLPPICDVHVDRMLETINVDDEASENGSQGELEMEDHIDRMLETIDVVEEASEDGGQEEEPETEDPSPEMAGEEVGGDLHPRFYYSWPCPTCNTMNVEEKLSKRGARCQCRFCRRAFASREAWLDHYEDCLRHVSRIQDRGGTNKFLPSAPTRPRQGAG